MAALLAMALAAAVEVHPAGPSVPENLLRIELRFSRPQALPFDMRRVQLIDATGAPIERALLDLALPDADGRRITVLLDPGRVKSGVGPNLSAGRALQAGSVVRLRVAGETPAVKQWTVTGFDAGPLQPASWRLSSPRVGSREALVVAMPKPISSAAERLIAVRDADGLRVPGRVALSEGDTVWRFMPGRPWRPGAHSLVTHPDLEDPAGNRSCAAFEQVRGSEVRCATGVEIPFSLGVMRR